MSRASIFEGFSRVGREAEGPCLTFEGFFLPFPRPFGLWGGENKVEKL